MSDDEIPDDVMMAAEAAMQSVGWRGSSMILGAARAIMAERERCAKVVEDNQEITNLSKGGTTLMPRVPGNLAGLAFATAIRKASS